MLTVYLLFEGLLEINEQSFSLSSLKFNIILQTETGIANWMLRSCDIQLEPATKVLKKQKRKSFNIQSKWTKSDYLIRKSFWKSISFKNKYDMFFCGYEYQCVYSTQWWQRAGRHFVGQEVISLVFLFNWTGYEVSNIEHNS